MRTLSGAMVRMSSLRCVAFISCFKRFEDTERWGMGSILIDARQSRAAIKHFVQ